YTGPTKRRPRRRPGPGWASAENQPCGLLFQRAIEAATETGPGCDVPRARAFRYAAALRMWREVRHRGRQRPPGVAGAGDRRRPSNFLRRPTGEQRVTLSFVSRNLAPRPGKAIV